MESLPSYYLGTFSAVQVVAEKRIAYMSHVNPYLVCSSRFKNQLYKCESGFRVAADDFVVGY